MSWSPIAQINNNTRIQSYPINVRALRGGATSVGDSKREENGHSIRAFVLSLLTGSYPELGIVMAIAILD